MSHPQEYPKDYLRSSLPLKFVSTPQSCTSPVLSPIYITLLQKRNSLALLVQHPGDAHQVHILSSHHVIATSLKYNQNHCICLKYFPSLVVDCSHIHEFQRPFCWHKEKLRSPLSIPLIWLIHVKKGPVNAKYSCPQVVRRWSA